jgi:hypothetical protein
MTASKSADPARFVRDQLGSASPDLLRDVVKTFAEALMSAEADAICGARYGQRRAGQLSQRLRLPERQLPRLAGRGFDDRARGLGAWCPNRPDGRFCLSHSRPR